MPPRNGHDRGPEPLDDLADDEADDERDLATGESGTIELPLSDEDIAGDD